MRIGLGLSISNARSGGTSVIDPETVLTPSGYWRAPYTADPWVGEIGGNLSGAATVVPGTTVNGFAPAQFDGASATLASASPISSFITATTGQIAIMCRVAAAGADPGAGSRHTSRIVLSDSAASGYMQIGVTTTGPVASVFDTAYQDVKDTTASPVGSWIVIWVTIASNVLSVARDANAYATKTLNVTGNGAIDVVTGVLTAGVGQGGLFFSGDVMEIITRATVFTADERNQYWAYLKARYPAAGLP
jgi:hypothetical protein